jgi:hypothetical protein
MIVRTGLSSFSTGISNAYSSGGGDIFKPQIGKVYGVVTTENTPTKAAFKLAGGYSGIGTIFYMDYNEVNKDEDITDNIFTKCSTAKPFFAFIQDYPLVGELVLITDGPNPDSQTTSAGGQKYYLGTINLWNNSQHNSPSGDTLGKTFTENSDTRNLLAFEGDRIYQGRKGNGIRFGSTVKSHSDINEWSGGLSKDGDPITILANGYVTSNNKSLDPNIEEINKEKSSIYLTTSQQLPLFPGTNIINPRVNTVKPSTYSFSQIITNSDRITLNAKKDEVLLFAKGNIEINTDNILNLNAKRIIHLHVDPKNSETLIALGTKSDGSYPTEPVILGSQMMYAFDILIGALSNLAGNLTTAATQDGPIAGCKAGGTQLFADLERLCDQLDKVLSTKVTTI